MLSRGTRGVRNVFESYLSVVRRRWRLVLVVALALSAVVFLGLTSRSGTYTSTAVVQVASNDVAAAVLGQSSGYQEPQQRLATELETFRSRAVATRAADRLRERGLEATTEQVEQQVTASARGVSLFLEVEGRADSAELARELTAVYVAAYTDYRRELQRGVLERLETDLRERLAQAESELVLLEGQPDGPATARQRGAAAQRYETATDLLERVRLRLSLDTSGVSVASEATLPGGDGSVVPPAVAAIAAVIAGLVAAVGAAMLVDLVRDPVRTRREVELLTGLVPLGSLPARTAALQDLLAPPQDVASAVRGLRMRLDTARADGFPRPLVVRAPAAQSAEAAYVAVALAGTCADAGMRTLLVAGGQDVTDLSGQAGAAPRPDLPHGLRAVPSSRPGLWLLPASTRDGSPGLAETPSPSRTLIELAALFDAVVVLDAGTAVDGYDARAVGTASGGALLVCVLGQTRSRWLTEEVDELALLDDLLVSVVLVEGVDRRALRDRERQGSAQDPAATPTEPGQPASVPPAPVGAPASRQDTAARPVDALAASDTAPSDTAPSDAFRRS